MQSINTKYEAANNIDDTHVVKLSIATSRSVDVGRVGNDEGSQDTMMGDRERLGEIVGDVMETTDENDTEVPLADPVPDPMQTHVSDLRHPLRDGVGSNADGHLIVAEQRGGGLGVVHVGQDFAFLCRDAGSGVQAGVLRLRDKGTNNRDAGGMAGDGVVDPVIVVGEAEVAQAAGDAACVGAGEEGGV